MCSYRLRFKQLQEKLKLVINMQSEVEARLISECNSWLSANR